MTTPTYQGNWRAAEQRVLQRDRYSCSRCDARAVSVVPLVMYVTDDHDLAAVCSECADLLAHVLDAGT